MTSGLREAFGVTEFEDVSTISEGHTWSRSLVFRIIVRGSPYLLKIITRAEDPTRHYTSTKAAAKAAVAPRVWHTDIEDKISITDFVGTAPFPVPEALVRLPALLRTLFQAAKILPKAESEELSARYAEVAAVYPYDDAAMVSSHNDLFKPENVLFDGQRVWLADWEAAFLNDRYADLAAVANQVVTNDEEEKWLIFRNILELRPIGTSGPDSISCSRSPTCSTPWLFSSWVPQASRSIGVEPCPNTGTIIGASGRGKSTWRTKT